jgi:LacI family transcriptional regulator, galactose operon repressor
MVIGPVQPWSFVEVKAAADADTLEGGRQATRALWERCVNCGSAEFVMPQDVSVTGFDKVKLSGFCYPSLTTVQIPRERIDHIIVDALIPQPGAAAPEHEIVIDPEFMVRDSTGAAPAAGRKRSTASGYTCGGVQ